jgi:hypothetical protein
VRNRSWAVAQLPQAPLEGRPLMASGLPSVCGLCGETQAEFIFPGPH